jgi:hypothetical protein
MWEVIIKDGIILVAGIVGGYVAAVLGGLHSNRWADFLHHRKLLKTRKTKLQALRVYNRIRSFREGKRDKYAFYIQLGTASVLSAIFAATAILVMSIQIHEYPISIEYGIVGALAAIAAALSLIFVASIYETDRQIGRFSDYTKEFVERWGSVDEENL